MKNKFLKRLLSVVFVVVIGAMATIEIVNEVIYQIWKLWRNGYKNFEDSVLKWIEPIYDNKLKWKPSKFNDSEEGIRIYEYDLDEELIGGAIE